MRHTPTLILPLLLTAGLLPTPSAAQLIDVGPGYVRAPFVRVQRRGGLRARVRAPFVDVGGGQRRYYRQQQNQQPYPTPTTQPMPAGTSRTAAEPTIAEPTRIAPPPTAAEIDEQPPRETQRARLVAAAQQLEQALRTLQNSASWTSYLRLPEQTDDPSLVSTTSDAAYRDQLVALQSRFESTRQDPRYQPVAALPEFAETHRQLQQYLALLADTDSPTAPTATLTPTLPPPTAPATQPTPSPAPQYREVIIRQRNAPTFPE